jgi:hypothetical protein
MPTPTWTRRLSVRRFCGAQDQQEDEGATANRDAQRAPLLLPYQRLGASRLFTKLMSWVSSNRAGRCDHAGAPLRRLDRMATRAIFFRATYFNGTPLRSTATPHFPWTLVNTRKKGVRGPCPATEAESTSTNATSDCKNLIRKVPGG